MAKSQQTGRSTAVSAKNGSGFSDQWEAHFKQKSSQGRTWDDVIPQHLAAAVAAITMAGDAAMFGTTTDGGALVLTIYRGGKKFPTYITPADDIGDMLDGIIALYK